LSESKAQFKDLFSTQAEDYAKFRPVYPNALSEFLASRTARRELAWDCGTGNGQAALALAPHFDCVIATDPSSSQLSQATQHPKVSYHAATAESSGIESGSVDLITVAQAFHWFKHEQFFEEVRRVARGPETLLGVWSYAFSHISPEVDAQVLRYYHDVVGPYWEPERKAVENGYADVSFPFVKVEAPAFHMEVQWTLAHLVGYLQTWSATQAAVRALNRNPLEEITPALEKAWGSASNAKTVRWPLALHLYFVRDRNNSSK
jgi:SAM-dependent methyltransferase